MKYGSAAILIKAASDSEEELIRQSVSFQKCAIGIVALGIITVCIVVGCIVANLECYGAFNTKK